MSAEEVKNELKSEIESSLSAFKGQLATLRTGRANAALLDQVTVNYYGTATPLAQCAAVHVAEARLLTVKPYDRGLIGEIEKAIQQAGLGITPQNDGEMIRLPVPPLTEERRKDLVKQSKSKGEDAKIALRNHRRDANDLLKQLEKDKEISQDELKKELEAVQGLTDEAVKSVDAMLGKKEQEILEV